MPLTYTYPPDFDRTRAQELGKLVDAAYDQLDQGDAWQLPTGYTLLAKLSAKEVWNPLALLGNLLQPVPFGFVANQGNVVYVVIRGTRTPLEWLDDFMVQPVAFTPNGQAWGNTTHGFSLVYADLTPQINQALTAFQAAGGNLQSIFVTGHSLGAALAHLAAAGIYAQFGVRPISFTFSGPRAGDPAFAAAFTAAGLQTWRIFNTEDIVPTVPPAAVRMLSLNMGMHGLTPITQALSALVLLSPTGYQHIGYPIAATFHEDTVTGNHSLDGVCAEIGAA